MSNISFFLWTLLFVGGVFGVEKADVTVSVMRGDSVTLNPSTEIPKDDTVEWWFGEESIAQMNKAAEILATSDGTDGRFRDRLKLDKQTGSLTITNITTEHTGLYKLKIMSMIETSKIFSVTVHDTDVVKSRVMEGDTVTLPTGIIKKQKDDLTVWKSEEKVIRTDDTRWSNIDVNDQTGGITIRNIRVDQSGDYEVEINTSSMILHRKFRIAVSDVVESVSVTEGDSVTLHTGVTQKQRDDVIVWKFKDEVLRTDGLNGRFDARWENIHLNGQTGELTIRNIRIDQSGDYEVNTSSMILHRKFHINISELKIMRVKEGDSVSLHIDIEIKKDDQIQWMFGPNRSCIAEINSAGNKIPLYEDGIFRDRLELDRKTGSLTIRNTRKTDTGVYTAKITSSSSRREPTFIKLIVAVSDPGLSSAVPDPGLSAGPVAGIVAVVLLVVFAAVAGVIYHRRKISELQSCRDV